MPDIFTCNSQFFQNSISEEIEVGETDDEEFPNGRDEDTPTGKSRKPQAKLTCLTSIFIIPQNFVLLHCGLPAIPHCNPRPGCPSYTPTAISNLL